jgi:hypothetical protein
VLGGFDGSLHLAVPSMNRLNQTEPAPFTILPCLAFFGDSYFLYFSDNYYFKVPAADFKEILLKRYVQMKMTETFTFILKEIVINRTHKESPTRQS